MDIEVPDLLGRPLVAFRRWRVQNGELTACYTDWRWLPGNKWTNSECRPDLYKGGVILNYDDAPPEDAVRAHAAPAKKCNCGLWGMFKPMLPPAGSAAEYMYVNGAMLFTGKIEVYHDGVRAEKGKPAVLALPSNQAKPKTEAQQKYKKTLFELADAYEAELVEFEKLEEKAFSLGDRVPEIVVERLSESRGEKMPWSFMGWPGIGAVAPMGKKKKKGS